MGHTAAQHSDPVVVAHGEIPFLLLVLADQAKADVTLHVLTQVLRAVPGEVLGLAFYVLWLLADVFPSSPDGLEGFNVSSSPL